MEHAPEPSVSSQAATPDDFLHNTHGYVAAIASSRRRLLLVSLWLFRIVLRRASEACEQRWLSFERSLLRWPGHLTFSMSSIQACRSSPKSMNSHSIPSLLYSSCSRTNIWWLKNCCSFSLVKLMHSCSKLLNCERNLPFAQLPHASTRQSTVRILANGPTQCSLRAFSRLSTFLSRRELVIIRNITCCFNFRGATRLHGP